MTGFGAYFSHSAQVTRNAHETLNPAKRRVFYSQNAQMKLQLREHGRYAELLNRLLWASSLVYRIT